MTLRRRRWGWAAAVAATALAHGGDAQSDTRVSDAIERVAQEWRRAGAAVAVDKSRFLHDGATIVVVLPDLPPGECTSVALLGARGLGFHARPAGDDEDDTSHRVPSEAGALAMEPCGATFPRRLLVTSDSGRGVLEAVVARSTRPLTPLRDILPERSGGAPVPAAEPGALPALPSPDRRAQIAEERALREGAVSATRTTWQSGADGTGAGQDQLQSGCHALELFALDPRASRPSRRKLDLDAEMRDLDGDRLLARDRTDAPDARLVVCVGELTRIAVAFAGAPPASPVLVSHVWWPLPEHLPGVWGADARAAMAQVLLARHVSSLARDPVVIAQGGSGTTPVPLAVEPGGCYLALAAMVQGVARTVGLRVHVGAWTAFDDRGVDGDGAMVAFCAGGRDTALAEIEAHGTPLVGWGLALYHLQSGIWEVPR